MGGKPGTNLEEDFQAATLLLQASTTVLVAAHISPDPDAVGSSFGLVRILNILGKKATAYLKDGVPEKLKELIGDTPWSDELPSCEVDLVVAIDTATKKRLGEQADKLFSLAKKRLVLDHHISNSGYGDINFIDGAAASSASIVLALAERLKVSLDLTTANLLYGGLSDDTGSFRFSNTTSRAFSEAKKLVELGANPEFVSQSLYFSTPLKYIKLRTKVLDTLELIANDQIATASASQALLKELGCTAEDTDGLVEEVRSVSGTKGAVFLRELENGLWKASLRSKGDSFDANWVAGKFEGGGHRAAAGCTLRFSLTEAKKKLENAILEAFAA